MNGDLLDQNEWRIYWYAPFTEEVNQFINVVGTYLYFLPKVL